MSDSHVSASVESADLCETILPLLSLVADNEASADESARAKRHVVVCTVCAGHLAFLRTSQSALRALPDLYPTPAVRQRIARQTFAHPTLVSRVADWFRPVPVRAGLGLAAVALFGVVIFQRMPSASDPTNIASQPSVVVTNPSPPVVDAPPTAVTSAAKPKTKIADVPVVPRKKIAVDSSPRIAQQDPPKKNIVAAARPETFVPQAVPRETAAAKTTADDRIAAKRSSAPIGDKRDGTGVAAVRNIQPAVSALTTPKPARVAVKNPARVTPLPKPNNPTIVASAASTKPDAPDLDDVSDNDARPEPRTLLVENDANGGRYSPESGRLGIAARRPSVSGSFSLASDERGTARASMARIGESNPFSDGPSLRNPIVTSPVTTN